MDEMSESERASIVGELEEHLQEIIELIESAESSYDVGETLDDIKYQVQALCEAIHDSI